MAATEVVMFSREMRRRASQSERSGRGFTPPGPGRPRAGGGCCIFLILLVIALVIYMFVDTYVLNPPEKKKGMATSHRVAVLALPQSGEVTIPHLSTEGVGGWG